ncbi:MAG: hypothetical protein ISR64_07430 [Deltaproteobacteria bacterium]|nr:hypothetical protein [Deltaproteobacteria bacterium]
MDLGLKDQVAFVSGSSRGLGYDIGALSYPGGIFDQRFAHGVSFRNYGEFPSFGQYMLDEYMDYFDSKFPFYTQNRLDVDKAAEVIREIELGIFPQFLYMLLANDHTYGGDPGKPTPRSMVADNDRGLAMIVDYLSNSIYWPETAIFVIQDDPQGSGDHGDVYLMGAVADSVIGIIDVFAGQDVTTDVLTMVGFFKAGITGGGVAERVTGHAAGGHPGVDSLAIRDRLLATGLSSWRH